MKKFNIALVIVMCLAMLPALTGCRKPYKETKYVEVKPHQTAYVIPLSQSMNKQVKLDSAGAYDKLKVAAKRIEIPQKWHQTGRLNWVGKWIPDAKVILVDRTPITEEFIADENKGKRGIDDGIWIESSDSVSFSTGFTVTAYVAEKDTSTYLYMYPGKALSTIINTEIRGRIQMVAGDETSRYNMDLCRSKKLEISKAVREDVIPFFASRGITITTVGMFGGFEYKNKAIQEKIDEVFQAQQEKEIAAAQLVAQTDKNNTIELAAKATANKAIEEARGKAESIKIAANAEAEAIAVVAEAAAKANSNPAFLALKKIELNADWVKQWDGRQPMYQMGTQSGNGPMMMMQMPDVSMK